MMKSLLSEQTSDKIVKWFEMMSELLPLCKVIASVSRLVTLTEAVTLAKSDCTIGLVRLTPTTLKVCRQVSYRVFGGCLPVKTDKRFQVVKGPFQEELLMIGKAMSKC